MKKLLIFSLILAGLSSPTAYAADEGRPPANVVTGTTASGMLAPTSSFVGTVRFSDTSNVASESAGKVRSVNFDEGDYVKKGSTLAVIDGDLLEKSLNQAVAELERIEANLQLAKNDYERTEKLYKEHATSEQTYDSKKYAAIALEKQKAAQHAAIANLQAQLDKKLITAPYDGVVISKNISLGEWVNAGSVAAKIAKAGGIDFIVNVPENILKYLKKGVTVSAETAGRSVAASFVTIIPEGDVANRSFPVKFRTSDTADLLEGMEVKVNIPSAEPKSVLFVNRDAVVKARGNVFVYIVDNNTAKVMPVQIVGYEGIKAGVLSEVLKPGMNVIVKGNERLQPDQPVNVIGN